MAIIKIPDGNAYKLRVTAMVNDVPADLNVVNNIIVNFVRRGRIAQPFGIDGNGRLVIANDGSLARGLYGVELTGYHDGKPWRHYTKNAFKIVDENEDADTPTVVDDVPVYDISDNMSFGGDGVTAAYVDAAIDAHNEDDAAHPELQQMITQAGSIDDVQVNGRTVVNGKVANIIIPPNIATTDDVEDLREEMEEGLAEAGKVDDVEVNGHTVLDPVTKKASFNVPNSASAHVQEGDTPGTPEALAKLENGNIDIEFRHVKGERGNGIASVTEQTSDQDGGVNTHIFIDTDGNTHVIHTRNGTQGRPGVDRQPVESGDVMISQSLGDSEIIVMSQKIVSDEINYIKDEAFGFVIEGTLEINKYYNNSGIKQNGNGYCCTIPFFPVVQGGVLSMNEENSLGYGFVGIILYDSSKTRIGNQALSGKVTSITAEYVASINPNTAYFRVNIFKTGSSTALTSDDVADFNVLFKNTSMKDDIESVQQEVGGMAGDVADLQNGLKGITDNVYGYSVVPSLTLNRYVNNSAVGMNSDGWAVTGYIDVIEGTTISMNKNNALGYGFYMLLFYGSAKNILGVINYGSSLRWNISYETIKSYYADATYVRINVWKGSISPALTEESVADFNIILKNESLIDNVNRLDGELQDVKEELQAVVGDKKNTFNYNASVGAESNIISDLTTTKRIKLRLVVARSENSFEVNPCLNFVSVSTIVAGTEASVHGCSDDITPAQYNNSYIGANHGNSDIRIVTCQGHGKTYADIGSIWSKGGKNFTIMAIKDENSLYMLGQNNMEYPLYSFEKATAGTYTHVSGATNTGNIVATNAEGAQLRPAMAISSKNIFADGVEITESGAYGFTRLDICENYDVMNVASVLAKVQEKVGTFEANPRFNELGADKTARHSIVYTFLGAGLWFINTTFTLFQDIDLGYFGFTQQGALVGNNPKMYIPKALPINNVDFRAVANYSSVASEIDINSAYWENPLLPPDRWLQYTDSIGLVSGYLFDYGVGGNNRKDCVNNAIMIYTSRKCYPHGIDSKASSNSGDSYSAIAFRRYFDKSQINVGGVICAHTFEYDGKLYIYADYNAAGIYEIDIPAKFLGKNIQVFEKSGNVALLTEVSSSKILVKVTMGNDDVYGYIVAQIK